MGGAPLKNERKFWKLDLRQGGKFFPAIFSEIEIKRGRKNH